MTLKAPRPKAPAGEGTILNTGYRQMCRGRQRYMEHRAVVEAALGRSLTHAEVVHHKDGNKLNNVPENLEVVTRQVHPRLHLKLFRSPTHKECGTCGEVKPRTAFARRYIGTQDPHSSQCKVCKRVQQRDRRRRTASIPPERWYPLRNGPVTGLV